MNNEFNEGYEWRVELTASKSDHTISDRHEFERFWGEQYEWTSMLPVAWKLHEYDGARIKAPAPINENEPGWWNAPLHLLGLGLGWTDIAKGIQVWEQTRFNTNGQPLLAFVYNTWGASISALGLWMRLSPAAKALTVALEDLRASDYVAQPMSNIRAKEIQLFHEEVEHLMISHGHQGERFELAKRLLSGEHDPFHLSDHFEKSLWPNEIAGREFRTPEYFLDDIETYELYPAEHWYEAHLERYAGFHVQLNAIAAGYTGEQVFSGKETVRVFLNGFGFLGDFTRHPKTHRWYLKNWNTGKFSAEEVHMWGN